MLRKPGKDFPELRIKKARHACDRLLTLFVIRAGFEPTTRSLEGCCSIQLSYRTLKDRRTENSERRNGFAVAKLIIISAICTLRSDFH